MVEKFIRHMKNLINNREYEKATQFKEYVYNYFVRKGQKTEYVYFLGLGHTPIHKITDEMLDTVE